MGWDLVSLLGEFARRDLYFPLLEWLVRSVAWRMRVSDMLVIHGDG